MSIRKHVSTNNPKLYVLTLLVDTPLSEESMKDAVRYFCNSIHSNDYSMNLMYADKNQIAINRRLASI